MTFLGGGRSCIGFKFSQLEMSKFINITLVDTHTDGYFPVEVVLAVLLERLQFLSLHKKVFWQMNGIAVPILEESESLEPQLPLRVTLVKPRN